MKSSFLTELNPKENKVCKQYATILLFFLLMKLVNLNIQLVFPEFFYSSNIRSFPLKLHRVRCRQCCISLPNLFIQYLQIVYGKIQCYNSTL